MREVVPLRRVLGRCLFSSPSVEGSLLRCQEASANQLPPSPPLAGAPTQSMAQQQWLWLVLHSTQVGYDAR